MVTKMAGASLLSEWLNRVSSRSTWKSGAKVQKYNGTVVLSVPLLSFAIK
jgi:hypothetical protein